ncbi:MAG: DUF6495 family protein [Bacteroidota bacterium]
MKYRRLSIEELKNMEKEFIEFLSSNQVTGDDWQKMKQDNPDQCEELMDLFSDIVFEKILTKINLLEHRSKSEISYLHFGEEEVDMVGVKLEGSEDIDFTKNEPSDQMIAKAQASNATLSVFSAKRSYSKDDRNQEVFKHLQMGSMICEDDGLYKALKGFKKD